jgi:hypothetical protein
MLQKHNWHLLFREIPQTGISANNPKLAQVFHELIKPVVYYVMKKGNKFDAILPQHKKLPLDGYEYVYAISGLEIIVKTAIVNGVEVFNEAFVR